METNIWACIYRSQNKKRDIEYNGFEDWNDEPHFSIPEPLLEENDSFRKIEGNKSHEGSINKIVVSKSLDPSNVQSSHKNSIFTNFI